MIERGDETIHHQIRINIQQEGGYRWADIHGVAFERDPNGRITKITGLRRDITDLKNMTHELIVLRDRAEEANRLKTAFLANMSHEIRTPLNAIVGFSNLIAQTRNPEEIAEFCKIIETNNELLLQLINDILDLSKIEAGSVELKYEEFDLSAYFNGMAASMRQRIKNPNVRLIAINPHTVCCVRLDKNRIAQILTNYVTNAIKYTPKGYIEMGYESSPKGIRFYVRDSGIGISNEKKSKVFMRFEKLDEFAQGTGLGLSICKAIAESMGGSVGFESEYGQGSYFWAFLPCSPETEEGSKYEPAAAKPGVDDTTTAEAPVPVVKSAPANPAKKYRVLIAEDIPSNFLLVSSLLKSRYELLHAENGQEAVEMAQEEQPDLILMDMKMPNLDGLDATKIIRELSPGVPIIALTAFAYDHDRKAALEAGCNDFLTKPFTQEKLKETIKKWVNK